MQLNLEKHHFYKLDGISSLKNHLEKLTDVRIDNAKATGNVEINLSYHDQEGGECFKAFAVPFDLDLSELKILEIVLGKTNAFLVEGQGLDIDYELVVNYQAPAEGPEEVEIELIPEENITFKDEDDLEEIKENISDYYEDKLAVNLNRNDHVIVTKGREENALDFLNFFQNDQGYYKLKCLYVESEDALKGIAKEYNVSLEKLLAGYDRKTNQVLFTI